jgi:hypothetical protein
MAGKMWRLSIGCLGCLMLLAGGGCGGKMSPPMNNTVEGMVRVDGTPVVGVYVQFVPEEGTERLPSSGSMTDEQGHYQLTCENRESGAVVGKHRVTINAGRSDPNAPKPAKPNPRIPNAYGMASSTPLIIEVKPDQHTYNLDLKGR